MAAVADSGNTSEFSQAFPRDDRDGDGIYTHWETQGWGMHVNSDGVIDPTVGSIGNLLDVLDTDVSGPGFGHVDVRELLLGGLVNKITNAGISAFEASNPGATLAQYLNQASFDTTIGDLSLTVSATDASDAHEISADVTLTLTFGNSLPLDLGIGADDLGISFPNSTLDLNASLALSAEVHQPTISGLSR